MYIRMYFRNQSYAVPDVHIYLELTSVEWFFSELSYRSQNECLSTHTMLC